MNNGRKECSNCGKQASSPNELKACGRCKQTWYCSLECQRIHWKKGGHKNVCGYNNSTKSSNPNSKLPACTPHLEVKDKPSSASQKLASSRATKFTGNTTTNNNDNDDPVNPCSICLINEDEFGLCSQCFKCGQLFCGECTVELGKKCPNCPTCRSPLSMPDKERFDNLYSLVHDRSAGRHTRYAQLNLGAMYANGHGVNRNPVLAVKYYKLAVKGGHAIAQCNLGGMYRQGDGVRRDYVLAVKYYTLAADQGYANAQYNLGAMHINGEGVQHDDRAAASYLKLAAKQEFSDAITALGIVFNIGKRGQVAGLMCNSDLNGSLNGDGDQDARQWSCCGDVGWSNKTTIDSISKFGSIVKNPPNTL